MKISMKGRWGERYRNVTKCNKIKNHAKNEVSCYILLQIVTKWKMNLLRVVTNK